MTKLHRLAEVCQSFPGLKSQLVSPLNDSLFQLAALRLIGRTFGEMLSQESSYGELT
jgi:hypothetical protein